MDKLLLTKCLRCRGVMIYDKFYGPHEQFWGWKCLICGEIVDPVILQNRQLMRTGQGINLPRAKMRQKKDMGKCFGIEKKYNGLSGGKKPVPEKIEERRSSNEEINMGDGCRMSIRGS